MTHRQFSYLVERYREQLKRADRRAGELIAMFYNANRDAEKDPKGLDWVDVFPEWKEAEKEQTEEEMLEIVRAFAASTNEGLSHQHS